MPRSRKPARVNARRGSDSVLRVWGPILAQGALMLLSCSGLYYGITQKIAVQAALFDERTGNMRAQIETLQRNVEGLERYIVELHQQERKER